MKTQLLKYGAMVTFVAALLSGCSSTGTEDEAGAAGTTSVPSQSVTTGTVGGGDVSGTTLGTDSAIARVFYFEFDKAVLNAEARAALRLHAEWLKAHPGVNIRLEGHADERGTREYNMALGERRANSVRDFLVQEGVSASVMEVISYGEESPAALGSNDASWALNRRVEMK
ncbi:MAG: peptidoglycan-associated lipoprotein Pal [Gammaproteobacteria bacterium]|nr:MAG: peptidoglycan-associated lipoprotein Pal [Gammaproteobacteria bacterium]